MLAYIKGIVAYKDAERAIIEAGGIGYDLCMSMHALAALPPIGNPAHVWTYLHIKEDAWSLFGFLEPSEKKMFIRLIGISGIGPKIAISALSTFKADELARCIAAGDIAAVGTISGVGKKTAQRVILELQGILASDSADFTTDASGSGMHMRDASAALESMGFSPEEVTASLKGCTESETSDIIRYALKHMGGRA